MPHYQGKIDLTQFKKDLIGTIKAHSSCLKPVKSALAEYIKKYSACTKPMRVFQLDGNDNKIQIKVVKDYYEGRGPVIKDLWICGCNEFLQLQIIKDFEIIEHWKEKT